MSSSTILLDTDTDGNFSYQRPFFGIVIGVLVDTGDMTDCNLTMTDTETDEEFFTLGEFIGIQKSDPWAFVAGGFRIDVSNGGANKHGRLRLLTQT